MKVHACTHSGQVPERPPACNSDDASAALPPPRERGQGRKAPSAAPRTLSARRSPPPPLSPELLSLEPPTLRRGHSLHIPCTPPTAPVQGDLAGPPHHRPQPHERSCCRCSPCSPPRCMWVLHAGPCCRRKPADMPPAHGDALLASAQRCTTIAGQLPWPDAPPDWQALQLQCRSMAAVIAARG